MDGRMDGDQKCPSIFHILMTMDGEWDSTRIIVFRGRNMLTIKYATILKLAPSALAERRAFAGPRREKNGFLIDPSFRIFCGGSAAAICSILF